MHNIMPRQQLTEWRHFESTVNRALEDYDTINDYFDCLIECSLDSTPAHCRRVCRQLI